MRHRVRDDILLESEFTALLDKKVGEQCYQDFIEEHTVLVPREFVQNHGVHLDLVFSKLRLADSYITDFFYLSKSSVDWNCVLIEIEKPQSKYFNDTSTEFHADFHHALDQINRWRGWLDEPSNFLSLVDGALGPLRHLGTMGRNPCRMKYVLVHGRRSEFEGNPVRTRLIRGMETPDFCIRSYDSLIKSLHSKGDLYVASKKNEHIEILSHQFVTDYLFADLAPSYVKITKELRQDILVNKESWRCISPTSGKKVLEDVLSKIGTIPSADRKSADKKC